VSRSTRTVPKAAALVAGALVGALHFVASVVVGPRANEIYQQWFDTGRVAAGADATLARLNSLLSTPIPTVLLNLHPSRPAPVSWWMATGVNSVLWGAIVAVSMILIRRVITTNHSRQKESRAPAATRMV
jgi:hypothetical protein